jgi:hypothetical protein
MPAQKQDTVETTSPTPPPSHWPQLGILSNCYRAIVVGCMQSAEQCLVFLNLPTSGYVPEATLLEACLLAVCPRGPSNALPHADSSQGDTMILIPIVACL